MVVLVGRDPVSQLKLAQAAADPDDLGNRARRTASIEFPGHIRRPSTLQSPTNFRVAVLELVG